MSVIKDIQSKLLPSTWKVLSAIIGTATVLLFLVGCEEDFDLDQPAKAYYLDQGLQSRSISFENPTGAPGAGAQAASPLGVGRKGAPARLIEAGETVQLCDIEGMGTIRHIWMTTLNLPLLLRSAVIRAYWEDQEHPSIEAPLGDFSGFAHGKVTAYESVAHSVGENAALNVWLEMPFTNRARITFTNEGQFPMPLFYQIDYTLDDRHPEDVGRLHVLFRRENPTTLTQDFVLLPERKGKGSFIGAVIGVRWLDPRWWGEGEVKFFLDGDTEFPTIAGTGAEEYVCLSFGMQETPFRYHGASLNRDNFVSMYRWHIPDPIFWRSSARVTIQQIGVNPGGASWDDYLSNLYERQDDWSTATFWYEPVPSAPLPPMPDLEERTKDIWPELDEMWRAFLEAAAAGQE